MTNTEIAAKLTSILEHKEESALRADVKELIGKLALESAVRKSDVCKAMRDILRRTKNDARETLRYAFTDENGRQCVLDGYVAIRSKQHFDELPPLTPEIGEPIKLSKCYPAYDGTNSLICPTPALADVKLVIAQQKAKYGKKADYVYELPTVFPVYVDARYLENVLTAFPDAVIRYRNPVHPLIFTAENGDALLLPVRTSRDTAEFYDGVNAAKEKAENGKEITPDEAVLLNAYAVLCKSQAKEAA